MACTALEAVLLIETDINGDTMPVWAYPAVEPELEEVILGRLNLVEGQQTLPFFFSKHKDLWHYTATIPDGLPCAVLPKVTAFSISIISKSFNPEKFQALLAILCSQYSRLGDVTKILEGILSVVTTGAFALPSGGASWSNGAFNDQRAVLANCSLKALTSLFGMEVVLIWSALALKKRVVVYAPSVAQLMPVLRVLPQLVWHRQDWSIVRPYVRLTAAEEADLTSAGVYCAGFTDPAVRGREELYDLFVDVSSRHVSVTEGSRADFALGKIHKAVATALVGTAKQADATDQACIKALSGKTRDVKQQLQGLCDRSGDSGLLTLEALQARKLPPNLQRFLYGFALAEGMAAAPSAASAEAEEEAETEVKNSA